MLEEGLHWHHTVHHVALVIWEMLSTRVWVHLVLTPLRRKPKLLWHRLLELLLVHVHWWVCLKKLLSWLLEGPRLLKANWVLVLWWVHFLCACLALLSYLFTLCGWCRLSLLYIACLRFLELQILILLLLILLLIYQCLLSTIVELSWTNNPLRLWLELIWLNTLIVQWLCRYHHLWDLVLLVLRILHVEVLLLEHLGHVSLNSLLLLHLHLLLLYLCLMFFLHHLRLVHHLLLVLILVTAKLIRSLDNIEVHSELGLLLLKRDLLSLRSVLGCWVLHAPAFSFFAWCNLGLLLNIILRVWLLEFTWSLEWAWHVLWIMVLLVCLRCLECWPLVIVVLRPVAELLLWIVECLLLDRLRLEESVWRCNTSSIIKLQSV